uniref:PLAC8 family protein n=1 Tax=Arcella intermedia TaxID=1963864 RepID=A0A6B2LTP9_9EUKA
MSDWSTGLCGCFEDFGICILTWFLPCVQSAYNKSKADGRDCHCCDGCCYGIVSEYFTRTQIKAKYGIAQDPCNDCCTVFWCMHCATCQHGRQLKDSA